MRIQKSQDEISYLFLSEAVVDPDLNRSKHKIINENVSIEGGEKVTTITYDTVLQSCSTEDIKIINRNGRDYPLNVVWNHIQKNALVQHDLKMGTLKGEYGHPNLGTLINKQDRMVRQLTIDPKLTCKRIEKMWVESNLIMGRCTTLPDAWGETLKKRIIAGNPPMASARALGGTDSRGRLIPSTYNYITTDSVERPGHMDAYAIMDSVKLKEHSASGNTMNECVVAFDPTSPAFANFVLSESINKQRLDMFCDALGYDYNSMIINENGLSMQRISPDGLNVETIVIPMKKLIGMEYHQLF